ncbi:interferon-induced protein 44-like isoform X1 [Balaenoptera musculus]|uniref:Interferon-induced protein 44-like n=1 Tax=Balaenoptera musculus TaxID=9771 RepID=A0A8B8YIM3_BALMU|nr:interferon-induced protein 44-like isoform X1 [Balaenoptera musculus]XP_036719413.1 interferon-induced protein 44-like isoform X1 [Balaenoptera musculus]
MAVRTTLTWNEEKSLQKLLGNVSLILLYKSTVHGNRISNMYNRCIRQGSTVTMIYCPKNSFGIFMLGHYPEISEGFRKLNSSIYFSFQKNKTMEMTAAFLNSTLKISNDQLEFQFPISPVQYLSLDLHKRTIVIPKLLVEKLGLNPDLGFRFLECEVFRVEGIKDAAGYINRITRATQHRNSLLADLRAYRPYADLVSEIRILLLGPVGSGKSSFFNSVKSIFHGHLTHQAIVGSDVTSITEQYRIYSVKDGKDGKSLPFMLCDSMGLDEKEGVGLCVADIPHILKGCVPDRYQFSPHKPITPKHPAFITSPSLKDRIHCVAYVFDINSIDNLSSKMVAKFKQVQKEVLNCGVAHVALFTKVNNCYEVLQDNFLKMNKSMISQSQIQNANKMLGIPLSNILVVENYASEREMDPLKDILILSALKQMFRAADDFLEDLPLE